MKPTLSTRSTGSAAKLKQALAALEKKQVYVGVPEEKTARRGAGEVSNAQLLYIHTHGSALLHIPARPWLEPALKAPDNAARITQELGEAAAAALDGKPQEATQHLNRAGTLGANAAKRWATDARNGWAPNAPETIAGKGSDRPLLDTGQLRRSLVYVVVEED